MPKTKNYNPCEGTNGKWQWLDAGGDWLNEYDLPSCLPETLFDKLKGGTAFSAWREYNSKEEALADLSQAIGVTL